MRTLLHLSLSSMNKVRDCMALLSLRAKSRSLMTVELSELGGPDSPSDPLKLLEVLLWEGDLEVATAKLGLAREPLQLTASLSARPSSQQCLRTGLPCKRDPLPTSVCEGGSELLTLARFGHLWLNLPQLLVLAAAAVRQPSAGESIALFNYMLINSYEEKAEHSVTTFPDYMGVRQV